MSSNDPSEPLDLERGLPTEGRDVVALRAFRYTRMTDAGYVRFLESLGSPDHAALASKPGPRGPVFRL